MIVFGVVLTVLGFLVAALVPAFAYAHLVVVIGVILLVVGVASMLIARMGHAVGGRRHYDRADRLDPASQTPGTPQLSMRKKYAGFAITAVMAAGLGLAALAAPTEAQAQPGPAGQWCAGDFPTNGWVGIRDQTGCHSILQGPGPDRGGDGDRAPDLVTTARPGPGGH